MTKITIAETDEHVEIQLDGHAEYDSTGRDIVCAACSVLVQSAANALQVLNVPYAWRQKSGNMWLCIRKTGEWLGVYTVARVGYEMLAQSYPDNVQMDRGTG